MAQKKYILLKDLPEAKAGTELKSDGHKCYNYKNSFGSDRSYSAVIVETHPEWFKEVIELSEKEEVIEEQPFIWTDELVMRFANYSRDQPPLQSIQVDLKEFKEQNKKQ